MSYMYVKKKRTRIVRELSNKRTAAGTSDPDESEKKISTPGTKGNVE